MAQNSMRTAPPSGGHSQTQEYSYAQAPSSLEGPESGRSSLDNEASNQAGAQTPQSRPKQEPVVQTTEYQAISHEKATKCGVYWLSPALMVALFLLGIGVSIAHHSYYQSLNDTIVPSISSQEWTIRIGTGLAFVVKAALAAAVGIAYTQRLWVTLGRKALSVEGVDGLFQLTMSPIAFLSLEIMKNGKLLCLMAASMWFIPLIATITPATLSINSDMFQSTSDIVVPTLNFTGQNQDRYYDSFRAGILQGASIPLRRLLRTVATGGTILQVPPQYPNSTFALSFFGPSLKCYNLTATPADPAEKKEIAELQAMFDFALTELRKEKIIDGPGARFYIGMNGEFLNSTVPESITDPSKLSDTFHISLPWQDMWHSQSPHNISCNLWNTSYTVEVKSAGSDHSTTITRLERTEEIHLNRMAYMSSYTPSQAAYKGYAEALRPLLTGIVAKSYGGELSTEIELLTTVLASCPELEPAFVNSGRIDDPSLCRKGSIMSAIEDLSQNFTLSILSSPPLVGTTSVTAQVSTPVNKYTYNSHNLFIAYGLGILVALAGVCIGGLSYVNNGYSASTSFSSILLTTRNSDLDGLVEGCGLPKQPLREEVARTKVRYGMLDGRRAAFGLAETVREFKRDDRKCV